MQGVRRSAGPFLAHTAPHSFGYPCSCVIDFEKCLCCYTSTSSSSTSTRARQKNYVSTSTSAPLLKHSAPIRYPVVVLSISRMPAAQVIPPTRCALFRCALRGCTRRSARACHTTLFHKYPHSTLPPDTPGCHPTAPRLSDTFGRHYFRHNPTIPPP